MSTDRFLALQKQYPVFSYDDFSIERAGTRLRLTFSFSVEGLCRFAPTTEIETGNLTLLNDPQGPLARRFVFALGLVELISYWKAACPRRVEVRAGALTEEDVRFWKKLYFRGLSEFFYRNGINNGMFLIETPDVYDLCQEGDQLTVVVNREIRVNGKTVPIRPIPDNLFAIIQAGGLVARYRALNEANERGEG